MKLTGILKKINDGIIHRESFRNERLDDLRHDYKSFSDETNAKDAASKKSVTWAPALVQKIEEEKICRICRLSSTKTKEELISPCACKGTLAYIHRTCLEKWLKRSGTTYCELCRYNYTVKVIERYSKFDSIRKWLTDEDNFDDAQDLIVDGVLALTFLPIVFVCCYGFASAYSEAPHVNTSNFSQSSFEGILMILMLNIEFIIYMVKQKLWIIFMLACVATSTVVSYSCWLALRLIHYRRRWSNWIRRHGKLILILDTNKKIA